MWRKIRWIALAFTVVIVGVVGFYGYHLIQFSNHIQKKGEDSIFSQFYPSTTNTSAEQPAPPKWEGKERVNILLLGGDSRGLAKNEVPRSDSNMVISVDPVTKKGHLFSILRDTYVKIPGFGSDRINTALSLGGPPLAMQTAGDLLGLKIQYYVYTDFQGFMALVDAIGGIDLEVEKDMKYHDSEEPEFDIDLKKGEQHMDGKTALQYVRFRHDALSDFTRTERQRKFMTAVADKLQSTTSIFKLPSILTSIDPYIETNMTITDMLKLGSLGFDVKASGVKGVQVPPMDLLEEVNAGGASVLGVNPQKLQKFVRDEFAGLHDDPDAADGTGTDSSDTGSGSSGSGSSGRSTASDDDEDIDVLPGSSGKTGTGTVKALATPKPTPRPTPKPTVKPTPKPSAATGGAGATSKPSSTPSPGATSDGAGATVKPTPTPSATGGSATGKPAATPTPKPSASGGTGAAGEGGAAGAGTGSGTPKPTPTSPPQRTL